MSEGDVIDPRTPSLGHQKAALWGAFTVILVVSLLAFFNIKRLTEASIRVETSQEELIEINRFLSDLKDVETGGRGYAISEDGRHLRRHEEGIASARATERRLSALAADDKELQGRLERLFALSEKRIAASRQLIAERKDREKTGRNLIVGLVLMDEVRAQVGGILDSRQAQFREQSRDLEHQARVANLALAIGVLLCLVLIGWLFSLRGREVERRRRLESELRTLNADLENRVQERTGQVKRASDLLNAVVENIPDMILLKEPAGDGFRYLLVNSAGEKLMGRDRDEVIGKTERDLFPEEEAALVVEGNRKVMETGEPRTYMDRRLTRSSGEERIVESRMVPISSSNGGPPKLLLAIIRDVTNTRATEDQLRQLQRLDAIGRLTGGVAHDFNNLLAVIHGNSELARNRMDEDSELAEMTDEVIAAAARGAELVKRLLAFARMQHLKPDSVDLNARLPEIIGLLQRTLGENVHIQVKTADELWPAIIDPTQADDALLNLAINARDAMNGGGTLTIETQNVHLDEDYAAHHVEVEPGDYVMLAVSDTGCGMSPDVVARAFEPFYTTKEEGQGTGLGLSQVFGWVKQSGGHIKIYSEVGHGTTIKLYLPRAEAGGRAETPSSEVGTVGGDETILVVEDNPNVRKTVIRQLHDLGYHTVEADGGASALRLVAEGIDFDLLMTDVVMPGGMTGYQLAEQLRMSRPDLKVLFTSGYTELARSGDMAVRKDPLLSKPYRKQDLGRAIRASLDQPAP